MAEYSRSTKSLFTRSSNEKLRNRGYEDQVSTPEYFADKNEPVPVATKRDQGGYLRLEINSTTVIGMFGPSGAGKTTGDMAIVSRAANRGRIPVNLADTDLHTTNLDNNGGVSQSLADSMGLFPGEEPREIKQKTLLPKYLYNKLRNPPTNVEKFTLGFSDLNKSELKFLLSQGLDQNQEMSMEAVLEEVGMDKLVDSGDPYGLLREKADENEEIHHATADKLKRNIRVLENNEIISSRYKKDVVDLVDEGYALGLGMKGFSRLSPSDYYLMEFYAKKCMELIIDSKTDGGLETGFFGVFPEAHHLMPNGDDSILADLVKRNFTFYQRRSDFPTVLDTQLPSQVSKKVLEEVNHVFIGCDRNGKSLPKNEWKKALNVLGVIANPQRDNRRWMRRIQSLNHREFLYVNARMSDPSDAPVVEFLAPLTSNP